MFAELLLALGVGIVAAAIGSLAARLAKRPRSADRRIDDFLLNRRRGTIGPDGPTKDEPSATLRRLLTEVIKDTRPSFIGTWAHNFFWFALGTAVSLFGNELRDILTPIAGF